jgi:cytochrome c556
MTYWKKCSVLILAAVFIAGCAEVNLLIEMIESPGITARKNLMRSNGKNWGALKKAAKAGDSGGMVKASNAIYKNAGKIKKLFAKKDMQGVTRAKPGIWKNKGDFNLKADNLAASAAVIAQIWAKSGNKAQINKGVKRVITSCQACHKSYRGPKNK